MPEKLERCVEKVLRGADFDKTYKKRRNKKMTRRSLAWAICRKSLNI